MRKIKIKELELIKYLTNGTVKVPDYVRDLDDGNMGSISFDLENNLKRNKQIASAKYIDDDGILVDIELSSDKNEKLFELDFWKIDFSPLKVYPTFERIKIK